MRIVLTKYLKKVVDKEKEAAKAKAMERQQEQERKEKEQQQQQDVEMQEAEEAAAEAPNSPIADAEDAVMDGSNEQALGASLAEDTDAKEDNPQTAEASPAAEVGLFCALQVFSFQKFSVWNMLGHPVTIFDIPDIISPLR